MRHYLVIGLIALSGPAVARDAAVPPAAQGVWAQGGKCHGETVTVTANSLQYKGQEAQKVYFAPKDSPSGNGGIHYVEEGNVDNFEYAAGKDQMIYHPEGYGTGGAVLYKRCH